MKLNRYGFTLVELMVATAITSVLMVMVFAMMFVLMRGYDREGMLADARQNGRAALEALTRDVRMAGSGLPKVPFVVGTGKDSGKVVYPLMILNGVPPAKDGETLFSLVGSEGLNDSIIVIYADQKRNLADAALLQDFNGEVIAVPKASVGSSNGFSMDNGKGMFVLIYSSSGEVASLCRVTGIRSAGGEKAELVLETPANASLRQQGGYSAGDRVRAVRVVRYDWSPDLRDTPVTRVTDQNGTRQIVAKNFGTSMGTPGTGGMGKKAQALMIEYSPASGTGAGAKTFFRGSPQDPYNIGTLRVTLWPKTSRPVDNGLPRTLPMMADIQVKNYAGY